MKREAKKENPRVIDYVREWLEKHCTKDEELRCFETDKVIVICKK